MEDMRGKCIETCIFQGDTFAHTHTHTHTDTGTLTPTHTHTQLNTHTHTHTSKHVPIHNTEMTLLTSVESLLREQLVVGDQDQHFRILVQ